MSYSPRDSDYVVPASTLDFHWSGAHRVYSTRLDSRCFANLTKPSATGSIPTATSRRLSDFDWAIDWAIDRAWTPMQSHFSHPYAAESWLAVTVPPSLTERLLRLFRREIDGQTQTDGKMFEEAEGRVAIVGMDDKRRGFRERRSGENGQKLATPFGQL